MTFALEAASLPPAVGETTYSLCILCHDRPTELAEALKSASGQAWHEVIVLDMASDPPIPAVEGVRWFRSDDNVGVTAGRNRLAEVAMGDVLVFLDDDAVFLTPPLERLRWAFHDDPGLGAVAFRVRRRGADSSREHPFRGSSGGAAGSTAQDCTYFVGCGYAVRRAAHLSVGGYDGRFFYSTEEVDLSLRLLRDGWHLRYEPAIEVEHRPSARGRKASPKVPGWRLRNRLLLVRAHLPLVVAVPHAVIWFGRTGIEAIREGALAEWWCLGREGLALPVDRRPLGWRALVRIHRLGGRVLY